MQHVCRYCEKDTEEARSVTRYEPDGTEAGWDVLCPSCYEDWLAAHDG